MGKHLKYPHVISSAVSPEVFDRLSKEQQDLNISASHLVRQILEDHYELEETKTYQILVSDEQVEELKSQGFKIQEQE